MWYVQTWKLREGDRLLDIVDPELVEYPQEEVLRFIKVALFCTQAASQQRPSMTQVVEMLSKEITLDESTLTQPGIHKSSDRTPKDSAGSSSSQGRKDKQSTSTDTFVTSTNVYSTPSITQLLPR